MEPLEESSILDLPLKLPLEPLWGMYALGTVYFVEILIILDSSGPGFIVWAICLISLDASGAKSSL